MDSYCLTPDTEGGGKHGNLSDTLAIRRPVDDVFAFLADFENSQPGTTQSRRRRRPLPGLLGSGPPTGSFVPSPTEARKASRSPFSSRPAASRSTVDIGPFTATISYLLAPVGEGTQLTNVVDLESASGAVRLLALLATSRVKAAVAANLDTLKKTLEASGQGVPG